MHYWMGSEFDPEQTCKEQDPIYLYLVATANLLKTALMLANPKTRQKNACLH